MRQYLSRCMPTGLVSGLITWFIAARQYTLVIWSLHLFAVLSAVLLNACVPVPTQDHPRQDVQAAYTSAAEKAKAKLTLEAGETAVAQLTQIAERPTSTPVPPTVPPIPTVPPSVTPHPSSPTTQPTPTAPPLSCDWAQLIGDVTVPIDSDFPVGADFTKTWRVENIGACSWTSAYSMVFTSGDPMGDITAFSFPGDVQPGQITDLSIRLKAPSPPGFYQGFWMLQNPSGERFGVGADGMTPLEVRIHALELAAWGDNTYDLGINYCTADWFSGSNMLGCPGLRDDPNGWVILLNQPDLESRQDNAYTLWTRPNNRVNGWISGQFPPYSIRDRDHFLTEIGCLRDSLGCDLTFQLDYWTLDGLSGVLGRWRETYDGLTTPIDINLSWLAGESVRFILTVTNNGDPMVANAFWMIPRVQNLMSPESPTTPFLIWTREGHPAYACEELRVYLTNGTIGEAQAIDCSHGYEELGWISLSRDDVAQLLAWMRRLSDFEAEVYRSSQPLISWINFRGQGTGDATDTDIQAIDYFASRLFGLIVK